MISFMNVFTEIRLFDNDSADVIISQEIKFTQINTIQIDLNDKILEVKDVQYISVTELIELREIM